MTPQNYNIIACDGGGIRGLLTALLLADLDQSYPGLLNNVSDFQISFFLGNDQYRRANTTLTTPIELDDYQAVPALEQIANTYIRSSAWEAIKQWASANFV